MINLSKTNLDKLRTKYHMTKITVPGLPLKYKPQAYIGKGSYGDVVAAKDTSTGQLVAIKIVNDVFDNHIDAKRVLRELSLLKQLESPYTIKMLDCGYLGKSENFKSIYIVMEYVKKDLKTFLKSTKQLTLKQAGKLIYNI